MQGAKSDSGDVDKSFVGFDLSFDLAAVLLTSTMKELIAGPALEFGHGLHPEVVAKTAERVNQRLEGDLDLLQERIGVDDVLWMEAPVGG